MAPQVFTRVMAPVSVILHDMGIRILRYLDNWLGLALSRVEALWARNKVLDLCHQLGIVVNHTKSHLIPSRSATYLRMYLESPFLKAFLSQERVSTLRSQLDEFMSCRQQGVIAWHSLLGCFSSLCLLVPGWRLLMHSFQLELWRRWDFVDESVVVPWTPKIELDLLWWYNTDHLLQGVSLEVQHPDLLFWSDALNRVGSSSPRPICLQLLVARGTNAFDQPLGTSGCLCGAHAFRPVSSGQDSRSLHGQYDSPVVCQELRGDILHGVQPGGATSPLGRVHGPFSGSPIYRGGPEPCGRLPELSSPGPQLEVDLGSGGFGRVSSEVAGNSLSFRHGPQLPAPGIFLSPLQSYGSGHGCLSLGCRRTPSHLLC